MQRERFDGMAEESKALDLMKMRMVIKRKMILVLKESNLRLDKYFAGDDITSNSE